MIDVEILIPYGDKERLSIIHNEMGISVAKKSNIWVQYLGSIDWIALPILNEVVESIQVAMDMRASFSGKLYIHAPYGYLGIIRPYSVFKGDHRCEFFPLYMFGSKINHHKHQWIMTENSSIREYHLPLHGNRLLIPVSSQFIDLYHIMELRWVDQRHVWTQVTYNQTTLMQAENRIQEMYSRHS